MTEPPAIVLVRHGATEWSASGRQTGPSDIPLSPAGETAARALVDRLPPGPYARAWTSPTQRARETARLAGFADAAIVTDLSEWDYGDYEGLTTAEIQAERPGWNLFADGCPNGEDAAAVGARANRIVAALRPQAVPTIIFSSAHFLRVLGASWAGWPPEAGNNLGMDPAGISILATEHHGADPILRRWNMLP